MGQITVTKTDCSRQADLDVWTFQVRHVPNPGTVSAFWTKNVTGVFASDPANDVLVIDGQIVPMFPAPAEEFAAIAQAINDYVAEVV